MLFTFACDILWRIIVNFMQGRIKNWSDLSRMESGAKSKARKYYRDKNKTVIEVQKCDYRNAGWKDWPSTSFEKIPWCFSDQTLEVKQSVKQFGSKKPDALWGQW